jgi:hypothetical protein
MKAVLIIPTSEAGRSEVPKVYRQKALHCMSHFRPNAHSGEKAARHNAILHSSFVILHSYCRRQLKIRN